MVQALWCLEGSTNMSSAVSELSPHAARSKPGASGTFVDSRVQSVPPIYELWALRQLRALYVSYRVTHIHEQESRLESIMELFRAAVPAYALAAVEATPTMARREALRTALVANRPQVEAFFRARIARFSPMLRRMWDRPALPVDYLDVGCGSGERTHAIARAFGVSSCRTWGCDIERRWGSDRPGFFIYDGRRLDAWADGSFDLVTLSMVLHHLEEPEGILREIRRVLRPGGRLLIREHDCIDDGFERLLDEFHWLMRNTFNDTIPIGQYRSRAAWGTLLAGVGLHHVRGTTPEEMAAVNSILRSYADLFAAE